MMKKASILLLLPLALAGCVSFGAEPPEQLFRLTPTSALPAATSRTVDAAQVVTVITPTVPQEMATMRVPVRSGATSVAYLKDAQWVELPSALFARLLAETIGVGTGRVVLDARQFTFDPGLRLTGQLQFLGVDADAMEAVVRYDGALSRGPGRIETRRFEARVGVAKIEPGGVAFALNQAANQVAGEVAQWVGN